MHWINEAYRCPVVVTARTGDGYESVYDGDAVAEGTDPDENHEWIRHCRTQRDSARLSPHETVEEGSNKKAALCEQGHRNFILTKHTWPPGAAEGEGTDYYMLYMHLDDRSPRQYAQSREDVRWLSTTPHLEVTESDGVILHKDPGGGPRLSYEGDRRVGIPPGARLVPLGEPVSQADTQWREVAPLDGGPTGYVKQEEVERTDTPPVPSPKLKALEKGQIVSLDAPVAAGTRLWWGGTFGMDVSDWHRPEMIEQGPYVKRAPTVHWEVFSGKKAFGLEEGGGANGGGSNGTKQKTSDRAPEMPSWESVKDPDNDLVVDPTRSAATDELTSREGKAENVPSNLAAYIERGLDTKRILHCVEEGKKLRRAAVKFPSEWGIQNLTKALKDSKYHSQRDEESYKKMQWWNQVEATPSSPKVWHYHPVTALKALRAKASSYLDADGALLRGDTGAPVEALQEDLIEFGFDVGPVDGFYGAATEAAVTCLQIETYYHVVDGRLDPQPPFAPDWSSWAIDGKLGPKTKKAMRAWIEQGLTAEYPRDINIAKKHPYESKGFILLDRDNCNGAVYHYQSGVEDSDSVERDRMEWWGRPPIVYTLERVCRKWADLDRWEEEWWDPEKWEAPDPPPIQIGDMTRPQGGDYWRIPPEDEELIYTDEGWTAVDIREEILVKPDEVPWDPPTQMWNETEYALDHSGHSRGRVADVRPMVGTEQQVGQPLDVGDDAYSETHSRKFLKLLERESPQSEGSHMIASVLFGDAIIKEDVLNSYELRNDHSDHYHIRSK